jgi:hypothetical protein
MQCAPIFDGLRMLEPPKRAKSPICSGSSGGGVSVSTYRWTV